jgi:hypothetical protein
MLTIEYSNGDEGEYCGQTEPVCWSESARRILEEYEDKEQVFRCVGRVPRKDDQTQDSWADIYRIRARYRARQRHQFFYPYTKARIFSCSVLRTAHRLQGHLV